MKEENVPLSDDPMDGAIRFYMTWNGHRYKIGHIDEVKPRKVQLYQPELFADNSSQLPAPVPPVVSTAFEVTTTPYEYREQSDSDDGPLRYGMNVVARQLRSDDYIVVSDEKFKLIVEDSNE